MIATRSKKACASPLRVRQSRVILALGVGCLLLSGCEKSRAVPINADLTISDDGVCTILEKAGACAEVASVLRGAGALNDFAIFINPSSHARYDAVAAALQSLKRAGVAKVSFVRQPEGLP